MAWKAYTHVPSPWRLDDAVGEAFIATAADQQSLMAFAFNAMLGTGLFGAIAVAREYGHHTVVPTFLTSPRRVRAGLAQLTAVLLGVVVAYMLITVPLAFGVHRLERRVAILR